MGIEKLIEEVGGAIVAEQAAEAADPNAGILVEGAAAIAGFVGVAKLSDVLETHAEAKRTPAPAPAPEPADLNPDDPGPEPK